MRRPLPRPRLLRPLTGAGRVVVVATAVLLVAGRLADYPELVALGATGLALLATAALWMLRRPDLTVSRSIHPVRVAEGEHARATLAVTNTGRRRSPPLMAVERVGGHSVDVALPSLAGGATHTTTYDLDTSRRGRFVVGPLTVGHSDPLRLLYAGRDSEETAPLWVHPRVHALAPVPMGRSRDMEGPTSASAPRGGVAFHSLREYEPGDDLRLIHWPSTARAGTLMVRHNVVPNLSRVLVLLDTSAAPYTSRTFEDAVRVAASLCVATVEHGFPLEVRTTAGRSLTLTEQAGRRAAGALDLLAAAERGDDDPGLAALTDMNVADSETSLVVVTGVAGADHMRAVAQTRSRFSVVHLAVLGDGGHITWPGVHTVAARDSEEFAAVWNRMADR